MCRLVWLASALLILSYPVSAEWKYDQNAMNSCKCFYGCAYLCGWACGMDVGCYYNPKASDASPACADTSGGPCICAGWGCGRCGMISTGVGMEQCNKQWAKPVCGDNYCETNKDENCKSCPSDCGCGGHAACVANASGDQKGCLDKCAGIDCKPKCENNKTLNYGGSCDRGIKGCVFRTADCKNGCETYWGGARCKDEEDKCKGVTCDGECDWSGMLKFDGVCNKSSGQCTYKKNETCPMGCTQDKKCVGTVNGVLFYTETRYVALGERVPMRNVKLWFEYTDKDGTLHKGKNFDDPEYTTWTDNSGRFSWNYFDNFDPEGKLSVAVIFDNRDKKLFIVHQSQKNDPYGIYFEKNVKVTDPKLRNYEMDLTRTPMPENAFIKNLGKIYHWGLKAIEYKENDFRKGGSVKEKITVGRANGVAWHLGEVYEDQDPGGTGMNIPDTRIEFNNPAAPCNREFHEYGHHIQDEVLNVKKNIPGDDHGGYDVNPTSEYGMVEGWAEFCGLVMKKANGLGSKGDYEVTGAVLNLELNYDIATRGRLNDEELSIAGIMWDLVDSRGDYPAWTDDDEVSLWPVEVYNAFYTKRDFGDGKGVRYVETVRDLYVVLNASGDRRLLDPYPGNANMTKLDQIFISHGVYQDRNNNSVWDPGEKIGFNGIGNKTRQDLEPEPGTEIILDVKEQGGGDIPGLFVRMDVNYSDPYRHLSGSYDLQPNAGKVYATMMPEGVNATMVFTAFQGGTNNTGKDKLTLTSKDLQKIRPDQPLGAIKTTIRTSKVGCRSDFECMHWLAGDKCENKTKTCTGRAGPEEPVTTDCKGKAKCIGEADSMLDGITGGLGGGKLPCCSLVGLIPFAALAAALAKSQWLLG